MADVRKAPNEEGAAGRRRPSLPALSGALQKIGGVGSRVESPHAGEASHMFFGNGLSKPFLGVLATHPPLDERIRAIDPGWDGRFQEGGVTAVEAESLRAAVKPPPSRFPLIEACAYVVGADGLIQEREAELLRAIADTLDCPIPPLIQGSEMKGATL